MTVLIGTAPNQVPINGYLGGLAFQDPVSVVITGGTIDGVILGSVSSIGVGAAPVASAKLQVTSTTQGFLPPVVTTTQKNAIASPVAGLIVFDSTLVKLCVYSGTAWQTITSV